MRDVVMGGDELYATGTGGRPDPTYPEHEKLRAVQDQARKLGVFLEWLESGGRWIAEYHEHNADCDEHQRGEPPACGMIGKSRTGHWYLPALYTWNPPGQGERIERILALYFGIDLDKLQQEKAAMLDELRAENDRREQEANEPIEGGNML
jgi:hypothetical protein